MKFVVDTDHLVIIQQQNQPEFGRIAGRMSEHSRRDFFVSIVTFHEEVLGWTTYLSRAKSRDSIVKAYSRLRRILTDFAALQVLSFDDGAAENFDSLRRSFRAHRDDGPAHRRNGDLQQRNRPDPQSR